MNGHGKEPPDEHKPINILVKDESILCGIEIKLEPIIKSESDDDIVTVSHSSYTVNGVTHGNSIGEAHMDFSNACDSAVVKPEVKIEKSNGDTNRNPKESSANNKNWQKNRKKSFQQMKNEKLSGSNDVAKNNGTQTRKKPKAKRNDEKKKPFAMKGNPKQHKCSFCDYVTNRTTNLNNHMLTHTDEKPYPCTICPNRFKLKQALRRHMKTHVDEFLFSCSNCMQGFDHNEEKMEHEPNCTIRRYECYLCKEYSTLIKTNSENHMRVHHTGERPFKCDRCSKKFIQSNHLKDHLKTHTNPRPSKIKCSVCFKCFKQQMEKENHEANCKRVGYKCDVCKRYATDRKSHLEHHKRIHSGEKPFRCEICSKCFTRNANLNTHKKIHK